jgi:hypothetical protein
VDPRKAALFNQVLENVTGGVPGTEPAAEDKVVPAEIPAQKGNA